MLRARAISSNDLEYYRERSRRERELAAAAHHPRAASAHAALADVYEALVANDERPTARILKPDFQKRSVTAPPPLSDQIKADA